MSASNTITQTITLNRTSCSFPWKAEKGYCFVIKPTMSWVLREGNVNVPDHKITDMYYEIKYKCHTSATIYAYFYKPKSYTEVQTPAAYELKGAGPDNIATAIVRIPPNDGAYDWKVGAIEPVKLMLRHNTLNSSSTNDYAKEVVSITLYVEHMTKADAQTVQADDFNAGNPQIVHITNDFQGLYHDVSWRFGGNNIYTIEKTQNYNPSWTPTQEQLETIMSYISSGDKSIDFTVTVKTYEKPDREQIGIDKTSTATMNVTQDFAAPQVEIQKIEDYADVDINSRKYNYLPNEYKNKFVQNFSMIRISVKPMPKFGATVAVSKISVITPDGIATYLSSEAGGQYTFGLTQNSKEVYVKSFSDSYKITAQVEDQRGFTGKTTETVKVYECETPQLVNVTSYRCKENGNEDDEANNVFVSITCKLNALLSEQQLEANASIVILTDGDTQVYPPTGQDPIDMPITVDQESRIGTNQMIIECGENILKKDSNYKLRITVKDEFEQYTTEEFMLGAAMYSIYRQSGGKGVSFGKVSTRYGLEVREDWPFYTHGKEIEELLLDYAHPIGSIIQTLDTEFDPNIKWPWTQWGKLEDVFLLGSGERNVLETGGSATETVQGTEFTVEGINLTIDYKNLPDYVLMWTKTGTNEFTQVSNALKIDGQVGHDTVVISTGQSNNVRKNYAGHNISPTTIPLSVPNRTITIDNQDISTMPPYITVNIWVRAR